MKISLIRQNTESSKNLKVYELNHMDKNEQECVGLTICILNTNYDCFQFTI